MFLLRKSRKGLPAIKKTQKKQLEYFTSKVPHDSTYLYRYMYIHDTVFTCKYYSLVHHTFLFESNSDSECSSG